MKVDQGFAATRSDGWAVAFSGDGGTNVIRQPHLVARAYTMMWFTLVQWGKRLLPSEGEDIAAEVERKVYGVNDQMALASNDCRRPRRSSACFDPILNPSSKNRSSTPRPATEAIRKRTLMCRLRMLMARLRQFWHKSSTAAQGTIHRYSLQHGNKAGQCLRPAEGAAATKRPAEEAS